MSDAPPFCPSCGFNYHTDSVVVRGPWQIAEDEVRFHGIKTALSFGECVILHSLAAAYPRAVTGEALANRCTSAGSIDSMKVRMTRMRHKLGDQFPIETIRGVGYRWAGV